MNDFEISDNQVDRKICPHHATITMKIDIRKMYEDGSLDSQVMGNRLLSKYGISTKAQICISGASEADCIRILKERLEKLNG
tara:strand:+ start:2543 stop:2788 length:246 start_codon:yes stop_codon:yes gene_type:complete